MTQAPPKFKPFKLVRPTLDTLFYIDYDWWEREGRELRVYLRSHLCSENRAVFESQIAMFPNMMVSNAQELIDKYKSRAHGWKITGAGGGGYLLLIAKQPIEKSIRIKIRRSSF